MDNKKAQNNLSSKPLFIPYFLNYLIIWVNNRHAVIISKLVILLVIK
jgi:hypothetical protein